MFCYKKFDSKRRFGVELELSDSFHNGYIETVGGNITFQLVTKLVEIFEAIFSEKPRKVASYNGWSQSNDPKVWHVKLDSTCGSDSHICKSYGVEIASYAGSGIKDILHISSLSSFIQNKGVSVNNNCGLHVHVEVKDFESHHMGILMANWVKIESVLLNAVPEHRKCNKHCRPLRRKKVKFSQSYEASDFWELIKPKNLFVHSNNDRKWALNAVPYLSDYWEQKTIELRLPESSLSCWDMANWIRLMILLVDNSKSDMPLDLKSASVEETLKIIGLKSKSDEDFYILSKGMNSVKSWLLKRIIQFGHKPNIVKEAQNLLDFSSKI